MIEPVEMAYMCHGEDIFDERVVNILLEDVRITFMCELRIALVYNLNINKCNCYVILASDPCFNEKNPDILTKECTPISLEKVREIFPNYLWCEENYGF